MRILLFWLMLSLGSGANADSAGLQEALANLERVSGSFQQVLESESGEALESSSGSFRLLRPGYFSWHIQLPEEQVLIAAGPVFWHYDVELETVTRRTIDPGNPTSPLAILGGEAATLDGYYSVTKQSGQRWLLEPKFDDAEFVAVELALTAGLPGEMRIRDRLGRTTVITLTDLDPEAPLAPEDFEFTPPAGVDLYSDES